MRTFVAIIAVVLSMSTTVHAQTQVGSDWTGRVGIEVLGYPWADAYVVTVILSHDVKVDSSMVAGLMVDGAMVEVAHVGYDDSTRTYGFNLQTVVSDSNSIVVMVGSMDNRQNHSFTPVYTSMESARRGFAERKALRAEWIQRQAHAHISR